MADRAISQLTAASTLYENDLLVLEQGGEAKKMAGSVLKSYIVGQGGIENITLNSDYTLTITYTNGTSYTTTSIRGAKGDTGDTGQAAAIIETKYASSSSGTTAPTTGWSATVPSVAGGNYLWVRYVWNDGTVNYAVSRYGIDGTGSVSSVDGVSPDSNGNVQLNAQGKITANGYLVGDGDGGVSAGAFPCNPNLLDNWYFVNPVNQRGVSGGISSQGYFIDRWVLYSGTAAIEADGITVNGIIYQLTEKYVSGAKATVLTDTGVIDAAYAPSGASGQFIIETDTPIKIKGVKLEIGSQQTLAHQESGVWVLNEIPDFGEQLARCQRYYCNGDRLAVTQASGIAAVPFPAQMRTTPAVMVSVGTASYVSPNEVVVTGLAANTGVNITVSATADL